MQHIWSNLHHFSAIHGDCHLSQLTYNNLLSQDIAYDRDSDLFRPLFGGSCGPGYYPDNGLNDLNDRPQGGSCARIWRSQRRLVNPASREALSSRDLRECEQFCRSASSYTCRSFSFTSSANTYISNSARNCELSDIGESQLRPGDMETDYSSDVYIMETSRTCGGSSSASSSSSFISKSQSQYQCSAVCGECQGHSVLCCKPSTDYRESYGHVTRVVRVRPTQHSFPLKQVFVV